MYRLLLAFLVLAQMRFDLEAHSKRCSVRLATLDVASILPLTHGSRSGPGGLDELEHFMRERSQMPEPIQVMRVGDRVFVQDGHRRLQVAQRLAAQKDRWKMLSRNARDFEWVQSGSLNKIDFSRGWVSPMQPGEELLRPELRGWQELIRLLRQRWSERQVKAFIARHREAYIYQAPQKDQANQAVDLGHKDPQTFIEYMRAMDRMMPMKLGSLAPVFPDQGVVLELGYGTGTQAYFHALMHPHLLVVGLDLSPEMQTQAAHRFQLPNLVFLRGNALEREFPFDFFDAVVECAFSHEVYSYGDPAWDLAHLTRMRKLIFQYLKPGGKYGMRDFGRSTWPSRIILDLPRSARTGDGEFAHLSLSELFMKYVELLRDLAMKKGKEPMNLDIQEQSGVDEAHRSFVVSADLAQNFLLRLNYVRGLSFSEELPENYIYEGTEDGASALEAMGFRVDHTALIYNPYHQKVWWEAQNVGVRSLDGASISYPPSNRLIFATKASDTEPMKYRIKGTQTLMEPVWMRLEHWRSSASEKNFELIRVPGITQTFLPTEQRPDGTYIYARIGAPMPGALLYQDLSRLSRNPGTKRFEFRYGGFGALALSTVRSVGEEDVQKNWRYVLDRRLGIRLPEALHPPISSGGTVMMSPGATDEMAAMHLIDVSPQTPDGSEVQERLISLGARELKPLRIDQILAASQVGSLSDPRLELGAYLIADRQGLKLPPWIGVAPNFNPTSGLRLHGELVGELQDFKPDEVKGPDVFTQNKGATRRFLSVFEVELESRTRRSDVKNEKWEFVAPKSYGVDTFSSIPFVVDELGEIWVGLEMRELPSFQLREMGARVRVAPAWRLTKDLNTLSAARGFLREAAKRDFGMSIAEDWDLGAGYFPSIAQSPERLSPFALRLLNVNGIRGLKFFRLSELIKHMDLVKDLHTKLLIYRLAHSAQMFSSNSN